MKKRVRESQGYKRLLGHALLSRVEERQLIFDAQNGDDNARDRLLLCNMKLIHSIVKGYVRPDEGVSSDDLMADGIAGFLKAVDDFDLSHGTRLSTYATLAIHHSTGRSQILNSVIRFPEYIKKEVRLIKRAHVELLQRGVAEPTPEQISEKTGLSLAKVEKHILLATTTMEIMSLSEPVRDGEEDGLCMVDVIGMEDADIDLREVKMDVEFYLNQLPDLHRFILSSAYGVGGPELSFQKMGDLLGFSHQKARRICQDSLESLQRLARALNGSITTAKMALENPQKVMAMQTLGSTLPFDKILEDGEVVERAMPEQMLLFAGGATSG